MPKVSIIVNCYNGDEYLRQALDSIYQQTFTDWEIIFWDNSSSDQSAYIAKSYDNKLRYFLADQKTPLGEARQLALEKASGEWIAFLDTDDYWFKEKLFKQIEKVDNTDFILCYAGIDEISENGNKIRSVIPNIKDGHQLDIHLNQFNINMVTPIISHAALIEFNITFDKLIIASEEYNIFLKLACVGKFCTIKEVLGVWRIRENSLTSESYMFWYKDRRRTLNSLKEILPDIEKIFPQRI